MGILEDMGVFVDRASADSPQFEAFSSGVVPQPSILEDLGVYIPEYSQGAQQPSSGSILDSLGVTMPGQQPSYGQQPEQQKPELTWGRAGGAFTEGFKDIGRDISDFAAGVSGALNRLKREIPGYQEGGQAKRLIDTAFALYPGLGALSVPEVGEAMYRLARSEALAQDPEYQQSSGWVEDFVRGGPQIVTMLAASYMGGPVLGAATMGAMITGGTYRNLVQQGVDPDKALAYGVVNGVIQGYLEEVPFMRAVSKFKGPQKALFQHFKNLVEVAGTEWATEFVQSFPDEFINIFATNPDKSITDRTLQFFKEFGRIAKQGAYEGTLTAPWSILTYGVGGAYNRYRKGAPKPDAETDAELGTGEAPTPEGPAPASETLERQRAQEAFGAGFEEMSAADLEALAQMGGPGAPLPYGVTPEEYSAQMMQHLENMSFDEEFARRKATRREFLKGQQEAFDAAMEAAGWADFEYKLRHEREARHKAYVEFTKQQEEARKAKEESDKQQRETQEFHKSLAQRRQRVQEALDFIKTSDFETVQPRTISQEQYDKLRETLGEAAVKPLYRPDVSAIPHGHRAAFSVMQREVANAEPKRTTYLSEEKGGEAAVAPSTYPAWFREKFKAGKKKNYVLSRKDFDRVMEKLETGQNLTQKENDIYERLLKVSTELQKTEPELYQAQDLEAIEKQGFEVIAGQPTMWGGIGVGSRVVVENYDGTWEDYQLVGERMEDGELMAVFANQNKEFTVPAEEKTNSIIAYRLDDQWLRQQFEELGPEALQHPLMMPETARAFYEAKEQPAVAQIPVRERRKTAQREAWDMPFRGEWVEAKDSTLDEFMERGREKVADKDREFLSFAQRMGKEIEEDTPLDEALRIIHARVQAGMTPLKKMSEMTDAEVKQTVVTDYLTGLRNKRAFDIEDERKQYKVAIDLDALKWINDNLGHQNGDAMLMLFGDAMRASNLGEQSLYHVSGDEYWMQHDDKTALDSAIVKINDYLYKNPLEVEYKGVTIPYRLGVSYGIGETVRSAEEQLAAAKSRREGTGERSRRGQAPAQVSRRLAERGVSEVSAVAEPEKALSARAISENLKVPTLPKEYTQEQAQNAIDLVEDQLKDLGVPESQWASVSELNNLYRKRDGLIEVELVEGLSLVPAGTEVSYTVLHAETGQRIKMKADATEALKEVDQQLDTYYSLLECLNASGK